MMMRADSLTRYGPRMAKSAEITVRAKANTMRNRFALIVQVLLCVRMSACWTPQ